MGITLNTSVCQHRDVISTDLDGEVVLMDVASGNYFEFNNTASRIWHKLEHPIKVEDLYQDLRSEYSVTPERIEKEIIGLLNRLADAGFISVDN